MKGIKIYTIGFTQTSAEEFFGKLIKAGVRKIVDARLNNTSQLAGFAKKGDLKYFLQTIGSIDYTHMSVLAPSEEILAEYKKKKGRLAYLRKKVSGTYGGKADRERCQPGRTGSDVPAVQRASAEALSPASCG